MRVFLDAWNRSDLPVHTSATIGNFDGFHRGQQAIVKRLLEDADATGRTPVVVTFEPHPLQVLRPEQAPPRLTTPDQKAELLGEAGIDALLVVTFDLEFSRTPARLFVEDLLLRRIDARAVLIGSRFVFGRDREGDLALLKEVMGEAGRRATGVDEVMDGGEPISSTRIRSAVARGAVDEARRLLGRPYSISGRVVHGDGLGRTIGWPTMNVDSDNELLPAFGVYRSLLSVEDERPRPGVTNVGVRPTMHVEGRPTIESHVLDYDGDLYDRSVTVGLLERLRGERRFSSPRELRAQIARDVDEVRRRFAEEGLR
jgi:riboflavin kinase/FMN adenylyltransferase